jgi:hypothetical protein
LAAILAAPCERRRSPGLEQGADFGEQLYLGAAQGKFLKAFEHSAISQSIEPKLRAD